ncbi:non-ribosomal peptide synthetase [Acetobacterium sp. K1/6]|jgi:amino acid adenylation domain-containing protein|uniref:non-ribosomal peptide synthetase n=1 Tax=Acetobacterium sp. K1/6 TaxID=3055467 RepID=UPI002ACB00D4|nr:non-ribosomal peptide synthetase [Acetobacterium sp. K1/6]MDZ5726452.1 amino acid adenylation domain-containing protein [Acetobacterium sp. K1/6]
MKSKPISHPQKRILDSELFVENTTINNIPMIISFPPDSEEQLRQVLEYVVLNTEDLNICFDMDDNGEISQYVSEADLSQISVYDWKEKTSEAVAKSMETLDLYPFGKVFNQFLFRFGIIKGADVTRVHLLLHHAICDGTSVNILCDYIISLYDTLTAGKELFKLHSNTMKYQVVEKAYLESPDCQDDKVYWQELLKDAGDLSQRINVTDSNAARRHILELKPETTQKLNGYLNSFKKPVSPFVFMLALSSLYFARFNNARKAVLSMGFGNRIYDDEINHSLGMYVSTVPVMTDFEIETPFSKFLISSKESMKKSLSHSRYPFDLILTDQPAEVSEKLMNVAIVSNATKAMPYPVTAGVMNTGIAGITIRVNLAKDDSQGLQAIAYDYKTACFGENQILNMAAAMESMIVAIINDPEISCAKIPVIAASEESRLLRDFNQNDQVYSDQAQSIVEMFRNQAAKLPDQVAVVFKDKTLTFKEVDEITTKLAKHLKKMGVHKETVVGIMIDRSELMVVYPLAVLKAGAAYMPLDYSFPADRLAYMLADADVKLILSENNLPEEHLPDFAGHVIKTEVLENLADDKRITLEMPEAGDQFVVLYTSGSTGMPKGCVLEHGNLTNFCKWFQSYYAVTDADRCGAYANFGFDAHMLDLYPYLTAGAGVCIIPSEIRLDFIALNEYYEKNKVTLAFMTTQLGRQFVQEIDNKSLRALTIGGEKLPSISLPDYDLFHAYGPTECTIFSTVRKFQTEKDCLLIGGPIGNYQLFVLDEQLQVLPIGAIGELCVGGAGVGRCYLNREELTREKFIKWQGQRIYRTGDFVRWLENGEIEFIGRMDGQVKLRGLRIELGEVESRMAQFEGITACCVDVKELGGTQHLCAYYTAPAEVDVAELKAFLAEKLTSFMIPTAYMQLEQLPLTPNGKFNKKALPEPMITRGEIVLPKNALQQQIFVVISEIVGTDEFGITDDLFTIGFTSLMAIRLSVKLHKICGIEIKTTDIISNKTIEKLEKLVTNSASATKKEVVSYEKQPSYPLTENQLGIYLECQKDPQALQYNIPSEIKLSNQISAAALVEAVGKVINRHSYLKTYLVDENGSVTQKRNDQAEPQVLLIESTETEYPKIKAAFVKPFDLYREPLYRVTIVKTPKQIYLLCDFHHIIFDGASLQIFLTDLVAAYDGSPLEEEAYTAFDLALKEADYQQTKDYLADQAYFDAIIKPEMTVIPGDRNHSGEALLASEKLVVDGKVVDDFCKSQGISPSGLFMGGLIMALYRYSRNPDVQFTTISNGRGDVRVGRSIGMLVKTLPIGLEIQNDEAVGAFVKRVQNLLFEAMSHEAYPFTRIAEAHHLTPTINFAYQAGVLEAVTLAGEPLQINEMGQQKPKFSLSIHINSRGCDYEIETQYHQGLYSQVMMMRLTESIRQLVAQMISNSEQPVKSLSMLGAVDRLKLKSFNVTEAQLDEKIPVRRFEIMARSYPERTALIAKDGRLSFDQLNRLSNRVANALIKKGIKPEDKIAFLLDRDSRLHIALFGILKSGAAFIPVDPEYPSERIAEVLADSAAKYLITSNENISAGFDRALDIDELLKGNDDKNPEIDIAPDNLVYLIYTSGSTGKPKGVMLEQEGLANYVANIPNNNFVQALVNNVSTLLSITTVAFDVFLKENMTALLNGITIAFADEEQVNNPNDLAAFFKESGADGFSATPSRMISYLESEVFKTVLGSARLIICGGEKYPSNLYNILKGLTNAVLFNSYGPTEITISSNARHLENDQITIGAPLANVREYICDPDGNLLPIGVVGELLVGGKGVGRGYLNNPELTAKQFISFNNERVYKTGDYAKWTENGEVAVLGRMDHQIKLRGLRIELGEIEALISRYPGISQGVVTIQEINGVEYLCAYYTAGKWINPDQLAKHLKKKLTKYMVPTYFTQLEQFVMNQNGKIDMKALPQPELTKTGDYVKPESDLEKKICEAFEETLGIKPIGTNDNFFEIGGTSLMATKLTIKAEKRGVKISYANIFKYQTPGEMAEFMKNEGHVPLQGGCRQQEVRNYNYNEINRVLQFNTMDELRKAEHVAGECVGNILLTGATGYLGVHILENFIENYPGTAYCVVRPKGSLSGEKRLKNMLVFYFNKDYAEFFGNRIQIVEGEITDSTFLNCLNAINVDTVINCAANVKHFAAGTEIENINVGGVQLLIDYCMAQEARLIQISTHSIAGTSIDSQPPVDTKLSENNLFIGQDLDNKYANSKFTAERYILEAVNQGLKAKIMRVGNLMARNSDGEFQINFNSNAFMGKLKAYKLIGAFPFSGLEASVEFAPIDSTAAAILKLSETADHFRVFHPYNNHHITMADVIAAMGRYGFEIAIISEKEFQKRLETAMNDDRLTRYLSGIIAYTDTGSHQQIAYLGSEQRFTTNMLFRKGYKWPITSDDYLHKMIAAIDGLGFFEIGQK